jgi:putative hemolysin
MSSVWLEILIIIALISLNGVLAMTEIAVVSSRKVRLKQMAELGNRGAADALELAQEPSQFLSAVQIGITLVGILAGVFGGATLAAELELALERIPALADYSETIALTSIVLVITYLTLVVGELAPKRYALTRAEDIAATMAPLMKGLRRLASPLVTLLSASTSLILRLLGVQPSSGPSVTEEDIKVLIGEATSEGIFEPIEEEMVEKVFRLGDRHVSELMTPRLEVIHLDIDDSMEVLREKMASSTHSRFPLIRGNMDDVLGVVQAKDLLLSCMQGETIDLNSVKEKAIFLPEYSPVFQVLERFRETRMHMAFVLDEFGGVQGIVTLTDIMDAIVGEIPNLGEDYDPDVVLREDGSLLLDGLLTLDELKDLLGVLELPGEGQHFFETLGGLVMTQLGRMPTSGDSFEWENFRFEVMDMDGRRVDKVLIIPRRPGDENHQPVV